MDDALFSVFPPTPDADWDKQLARELRGASYEEKLLWSPPDTPADAPKIRPYYRRGTAPPPPPLPRHRPFRYFSALVLEQGSASGDATWATSRLAGTLSAVLRATEQARHRDAAGLDLWGATADLFALRSALGGDSVAGPFALRYFATDFPNPAQPLPEGLLYDLAGYRAASGGAGHSLDAYAWDRLAAAFKAAGHDRGQAVHPAGYLDGSLFGNAGADIPTEMALIWAALHEMIDELAQRGLPPEAWTGRLVLRVASGPNFFAELAKFRALRIGWDLLSQSLPGREHPLPCPEILGTAVSWNLAASDTHNNLLRLSTEAASAMLGGVDSLSLPRFDAPTAADSDFSRRISDNLALLLDKESHLLRVDDPAAGSWYLEHLTDDLGALAWTRFQAIEALGGFTAALQNGQVHTWIKEARTRKAFSLVQPGSGWIGVTRFRPVQAANQPANADATSSTVPAAQQALAPTATPAGTSDPVAGKTRAFDPILPWLAEQELAMQAAHNPPTKALETKPSAP